MDNKIIANLKALGIDMIDAAQSGHPGIVLGAAPILYTIYAKHMNISTVDNSWISRDRFVMSAGHGSALLYSTLYMAGFNLSLDDLKKFRRVGYKTPGHPEYGMTPGVDMSTGPLGQGFASAVGMALGEKILESKFTISDGKPLIDYDVYVLCGDGDLMEGISYEAASLAGTLNLDNLVVLYDSNNISLDGDTSNTFTENVSDRFKALGWHTEKVVNCTVEDIDKAIKNAKNDIEKLILQKRITVEPICFPLLPELFTLTQFQNVYEAITGKKVDKRNFRKRIAEMDYIEKTDKIDKSGSKRGAILYRFNEKVYRKAPKFKL